MRENKIRKGEKILVLRVSEPIQEQYDKLDKVTDELKWMHDEYQKLKKMDVTVPEEKIAALARHGSLMEKLRDQMWWDINEQYGLWHHKGVAIRDGYCIVKCRELPDPETVMKKIKKMLLDELGEDYGIDMRRMGENPDEPDDM